MNSAARREAFHHTAGSPDLKTEAMFPFSRPLLYTPPHILVVHLDPSLLCQASGWNGKGGASPLPLFAHTCSLNRGSQGLAPEIPVAGRRWVETQSQAGNKYDEK